jgi:hypothetical protein
MARVSQPFTISTDFQMMVIQFPEIPHPHKHACCYLAPFFMAPPFMAALQGMAQRSRLITDGTGFMNLHSFPFGDNDLSSPFGAYTNSDGSAPRAGLTLSGNVVYGTTRGGARMVWAQSSAFPSHRTNYYPF